MNCETFVASLIAGAIAGVIGAAIGSWLSYKWDNRTWFR